MREPLSSDEWIVDLRSRTPPLRWDEVFSVPVVSVELELGSGKGMFLRQASGAHPTTGFIGTERSAKFFGMCASRLARDAMPNARIVCSDAMDLLARWIPASSLAALHVYFPDPWPKKRHAKRRMLCPALYALAARALEPDGFLAIATDVATYFEESVVSLASHPAYDRMEVTPADVATVMTNYALKYAREGRSLYLARWKRNLTSPPPLPPPPSRRRRDASIVPSPGSADGP